MMITSKHQFFELWKAGVLGNRTQLWTDPEDAYASMVPEIGFREIGKAGGGAWEKVKREDVFRTANMWTALGRKFIMDDGAPNHRSTMQGEVCRTVRGLESFLAVGYGLPPMRQSIAAGLHRSYGYVETMVLLDRYMDPSSRDDLNMLLELYPEATVELSCFDVQVGNIPGRQVMFWEVRDY